MVTRDALRMRQRQLMTVNETVEVLHIHDAWEGVS